MTINCNPYNYRADSAMNRGRYLGEAFISPHILKGADAVGNALSGTYTLKADTAFYTKCVKEKEAGVEQTITVGDYSFTGYVYSPTQIYYDISEKPIVDSIYEATGKAFYYGIDTENQRIFLPRLKHVTLGMGSLNGTIRCKGNKKSLGLDYQNGSGTLMCHPGSNAGAWQVLGMGSNQDIEVGSNAGNLVSGGINTGVGINPDSRYSGINVDGQTIEDVMQPAYLYFCVGNTLVNAANIDAEKLTGDVRSLEANALTRNDKVEIVSWGMPDYSAGIITESGFIADEDYLVYAIPAQLSNVWCVITNADNLALYQCWLPNGYQQQIGGWFKLPKGEKLLVASGSFTAVTRFPLIGGKND